MRGQREKDGREERGERKRREEEGEEALLKGSNVYGSSTTQDVSTGSDQTTQVHIHTPA